MPTTLSERTRNEAPSVPRWARWAAGAVAVGLATILAGNVLRGPRFVSQVSFVNSGPYALDVQVASAGDDDWLALGTLAPGQTTPIYQVVDQGGTWDFNVTAQGADGGGFTVARTDLVAAGWRVTIPSAVIARLRDEQIPATPTDH